LGIGFMSPRFSLHSGSAMQWKYRGQITRSHQKMQIEVQIRNVQSAPGHTVVVADASLWADSKRIYEIINIGMDIREG